MQQNPGKGKQVAGLVLGIISLVFYWAPYFNIVTLILGIVGIVLSVKGKKASAAVGAPTGAGTAGLVLSIIGVVLSGIGVFTCTLCAGALCAAEDAIYDAYSLYY